MARTRSSRAVRRPRGDGDARPAARRPARPGTSPGCSPSRRSRRAITRSRRHDRPRRDLRLAEPIEGRVRLARTNRGRPGRRRLPTASRPSAAAACATSRSRSRSRSRRRSCRSSTSRPAGRSTRDAEPDALRLTDHHELDLEPPVREAILLAEPIAPLCRPDCPGLCIECGERLDDGEHEHGRRHRPAARGARASGSTPDGQAAVAVDSASVR